MTTLPTLTAAQVRRARALLRWSSPRLSRVAGVSFATALRAQSDDTMAALSFADVWAIRGALEKAGVRFAFDAEGQPGAELVAREG